MTDKHLTWKQIQEKYPNQWVGLVDIEYEPDNDATIQYATVQYIDKDKNELTEMQIDSDGKVLARYTTPDNTFQLGSVGYFG